MDQGVDRGTTRKACVEECYERGVGYEGKKGGWERVFHGRKDKQSGFAEWICSFVQWRAARRALERSRDIISTRGCLGH